MSAPPDPAFADPRLAPLYDVFEDDRADLDVYADIVAELGARTVLDVGCGTGELAVRLARRGTAVVGVDPAAASLDVARAKPDADRVRWVDGDATVLADRFPELAVDLAVMTGNVAQVFVDDGDWIATLVAIRGALRPGGALVFETRRPEVRAWERWVFDLGPDRAEVDGRVVETRFELLEVVEDPLVVRFRFTYRFDPDGRSPETIVSDSTLRFRSMPDLASDVVRAGFRIAEVRDAPDRPGREWVVVAERRA